MNKVITINLAGRAYSVEEPGYIALKEYLDKADKNLADNPDKDEILKDFNMAIAEKCDTYLSASKNVVTSAEIEKILAEMGPVEGTQGAAGADTEKTSSGSSGSTEEKSRHKKLYLLPDTGVIFGVCSGLAAYFDIDVTIIRVIFIGLTILTHGAWILVYFIMSVVIPKANTPEKKAAAWGDAHMTAQDFIQKARTGYENFKNSDDWKKWKKQMKEQKQSWKQREKSYRYGRPSPFYELAHSVIGILWLAFLIYISWYGYNHILVVHNFFTAIGGIIQEGINWLKMKTGQQ